MSNPVDGENEEATQPESPETGEAPPEVAVSDAAVSDAIDEAAALADAPPLAERDVADAVNADAGISDAEIPALDIPEPQIPEPELPASALAEPVIPPAPASDAAGGTTDSSGGSGVTGGSDRIGSEGLASADSSGAPGATASDSVALAAPATRAARRALPSVESLPEPAPIPRDPAVVPPASGATTGGYRGWTIAIFAILLLLLIGAIVTITVLATGGVNPFPVAAVPTSGWILLIA